MLFGCLGHTAHLAWLGKASLDSVRESFQLAKASELNPWKHGHQDNEQDNQTQVFLCGQAM